MKPAAERRKTEIMVCNHLSITVHVKSLVSERHYRAGHVIVPSERKAAVYILVLSCTAPQLLR